MVRLLLPGSLLTLALCLASPTARADESTGKKEPPKKKLLAAQNSFVNLTKRQSAAFVKSVTLFPNPHGKPAKLSISALPPL